MAVIKSNVSIPNINTNMEKLKSVGIDISNYTLDEIQLAYYRFITTSVVGESAKHSELVGKLWKPGIPVASAIKTVNDYSRRLKTLVSLDIDELVKKYSTSRDEHGTVTRKSDSVSFATLKDTPKTHSFKKEKEKGLVKIKEKESEED